MSAEPLLNARFDQPNFERKIIKARRIDIFAQNKTSVTDSFANDVETGLTADPKYLLPKYFYDEAGSQLFEQITETKEYYPTRTERQILQQNISAIQDICKGIDVIAELGSGSSDKTKIILSHFTEHRKHLNYIPIDVSEILVESSKDLVRRYRNLSITGIISEYEQGLSLLEQIEERPKLLLFLGSSIGNFENDAMIDFLQEIGDALHEKDYLLMGFDLEKDEKILNRAYNDKSGITSAFNLNLLLRINRELNADFNPDQFRHHAFYNKNKHRVEMHLVSKTNQFVHIGKISRKISFRQGESIQTEYSHKFSEAKIREYANQANLRVVRTWKDKKNYFALSLIAPK